MSDADEEGKKKVRLALDTDAAELLLQLAPGPRKQGEFVSKLIREAAAEQTQASHRIAPDLDSVWQVVKGLLRDVAVHEQEIARLKALLKQGE